MTSSSSHAAAGVWLVAAAVMCASAMRFRVYFIFACLGDAVFVFFVPRRCSFVFLFVPRRCSFRFFLCLGDAVAIEPELGKQHILARVHNSTQVVVRQRELLELRQRR